MLLPLAGSALVGGLIGYSTNWLAIKMLFWPLQEKRVGNWRVPFTPGLIPKKRAGLAASLGETVANYLVTPTTLQSALAAPEFRESWESALQTGWEGLRSESRSLADLLQVVPWLPDVPQLAELAAKPLAAWLLSEPGEELIWRSAGDCVRRLLSAVSSGSEEANPVAAAAERLLAGWEAAGWRDRAAELLSRHWETWRQSQQTVGEHLPEELRTQLRSYVLESGPDWLDRLAELLRSEASQQLLKQLLKEVLNANPMLRMLSALVDVGRLVEGLPGVLAKEEVRTRILLAVLGGLDRLWAQPVSQLAARVWPLGPQVESVRQWLDRWLPAERLAGLVQSWVCRIQAVLPQLGAGDATPLLGPVQSELRALLHAGLAGVAGGDVIQTSLQRLLVAALALRPGQLLPTLSREQLRPVHAWLHQQLTGSASRHAERLLHSLQLPKIVEAQVNALDIVEVEEILLRVMREQLRAITNLGFLLGALVGLLLPFLNSWLAAL